MVLKLLLLLLLTVSLSRHVNTLNNAIAFNLPNARFCKTCNIENEMMKAVEPDSEIDNLCKQYTENVYKHKALNAPQAQLLETFQNSNMTFIFYSWMRSRFLFEYIYEKSYTFRLFVSNDRTNNSDFCIRGFYEGNGFTTTNLTRRGLEDLIEEGRTLETIYIDATMDLWAIETCNTTYNRDFIMAAKNRFKAKLEQTKSWEFPIVMYPTPFYGFPKYTNKSMDTCGDNPSDMDSDYDVSDDCSGMYCSFSSKRQKLNDGSSNRVEPDRNKAGADTDVSSGSESCQKTKDNSKDPQIYINEIKPCRPDITRSEFIELRRYPHDVNSQTYINAHKIVAFTASLKMIAVISLHQLAFNQQGYLVIDDNFRSRIQYAQEAGSFDVLPCSTDEPIIVALLRKDSNLERIKWDEIKLKGKKERNRQSLVHLDTLIDKKGVQSNLMEIIQQTVIDAYMYGAHVNNEIDDRINRMLKVSPNNCNYVLSPGNPRDRDENDLSLNFCQPYGHLQHFSHHFYKLGAETPGTANDCSYTLGFQANRFEENNDEEDFHAGVTVNAEYADECPLDERKTAVIESLIEDELHFIRETNPEYVNKYYPIKHFADTTWTSLKNTGFDSSVTGFPDVTPFKVINGDNGGQHTPVANAHWRCELCYRTKSECPHSLGPGRSDLLSKKEGVAIPTKAKKARRVLVGHTSNIKHYLSVLLDVKKDRLKIVGEKREIFKKSDNHQFLQPLANQFLTAYTFVKTNTAITNTKTWYKTLIKIGANVGTRSQSKEAAFSMIHFIADIGQDNLIKHMMKNKFPFSIICDSSSDRRNYHYILLYIQTLEGEETMPVYVGLLKLGKSSTSDSQLLELKKWVAKQGPEFEEYFKDFIVAVITDSAAVMQRFHLLVSRWVGRTTLDGDEITLIKINCLAHKLQLTSRSSIIPLKTDSNLGTNDSLTYFQDIEKFTQTTYTWLALAQRRIGDYREIVIINDLPRVELKSLHTNRWVSSSHSTIVHFLTAWRGTVYTMEQIRNDTIYPRKTREEADTFFEELHDKQKLITLVFLQDYTSAFKKWSEALQRFVGLMSDQEEAFESLHEDLNTLELFESPALTSFLSECKCTSSEDPTSYGCTLEEYEDSVDVTYNTITFTETDEDAPLLSVLGKDLIDKTRERLEHYIPIRLVRATSVINPKKLPPGRTSLNLQGESVENNEDLPLYGKKDVEYLGLLLGLNAPELLQNWAVLIEAIVSNPSWDVQRKDHDTESFWTSLLRNKKMPWTETTRKFIRSLKVLAPGSTLCESGFSIFNVVKNQRRSHISDKNLETILSIIVNGPDDIEKLDEFGYASRWYALGHTMPVAESCPENLDDASYGTDEIEDFFVSDINDFDYEGEDSTSESQMQDFLSQSQQAAYDDDEGQTDTRKEKVPRVRSVVYGIA